MSTEEHATLKRRGDIESASGDLIGGARPSKVRRIPLACQRCQKRKIKCDGGVPKCSACSRANAECVDGRKTGYDGGIARADIAALQRHIRSLERELLDRTPDIDLASLRPADDTGPPTSQVIQAPDISHTSFQTRDRTGSNLTACAVDVGELADSSDTNRQVHSPRPTVAPVREKVTHDIGLVPISAGISRYVGPSSGFALTNIILDRAKRKDNTNILSNDNGSINPEHPSTTTSYSVLAIEPGSLPISIIQAIQLSKVCFEHVHSQYPFLHEPTFFDLLRTRYRTSGHTAPWITFQVTMVLAISASILSKRLPISFSGESLCALALRDIGAIDTQGSLEGLQCLLLVYMFTLYSPFSGINPWYLNYQFLATTLDIGLQRDPAPGNAISLFDREMRTRIFWVIYTIDRTLATTLGRPIGLRDEACDLRQPIGIEDHDLMNPALESSHQEELSASVHSGRISCARTLFRFAELNSEIKYILHSVNKKTPPYTYPQIPDIVAWQDDVWQRLRDCDSNAPKFTADKRHLTVICSIRFHEVTMHLFRPTPHIRNPTQSSLLRCHESAGMVIELWKSLYEVDRITYSWTTIHSVCLSALTILYCIWTSQDIAASTRIDTFTSMMRDASVLLSAAGEYWIEARKSRYRLDALSSATVRWLADKLDSRNMSSVRRSGHTQSTASADVHQTDVVSDGGQHSSSTFQQSSLNRGMTPLYNPTLPNQNIDNGAPEETHSQPTTLPMDVNGYISNEDLASFLGAPDIFTSDNAFLMEGMFTDYQPLFDLGDVGTGTTWIP